MILQALAQHYEALRKKEKFHHMDFHLPNYCIDYHQSRG